MEGLNLHPWNILWDGMKVWTGGMKLGHWGMFLLIHVSAMIGGCIKILQTFLLLGLPRQENCWNLAAWADHSRVWTFSIHGTTQVTPPGHKTLPGEDSQKFHEVFSSIFDQVPHVSCTLFLRCRLISAAVSWKIKMVRWCKIYFRLKENFQILSPQMTPLRAESWLSVEWMTLVWSGVGPGVSALNSNCQNGTRRARAPPTPPKSGRWVYTRTNKNITFLHKGTRGATTAAIKQKKTSWSLVDHHHQIQLLKRLRHALLAKVDWHASCNLM